MTAITGKPWTEADDAVIREAPSFQHAADQLGRTYAAVRKRASRIGAHRYWTERRATEWNNLHDQPTDLCWVNPRWCGGWMIYDPIHDAFRCSQDWSHGHRYFRKGAWGRDARDQTWWTRGG